VDSTEVEEAENVELEEVVENFGQAVLPNNLVEVDGIRTK